MALPERITVELLEQIEACSDQIQLFRETFGESADLTRANLMRAAEAGLILWWLVNACLDGEIHQALAIRMRSAAPPLAEARGKANAAFEEALKDARQVMADARAVEQALHPESSPKQRRAATTARVSAEYRFMDACASANAAYAKVMAPARDRYDRLYARTLADVLGLPDEPEKGASGDETTRDHDPLAQVAESV